MERKRYWSNPRMEKKQAGKAGGLPAIWENGGEVAQSLYDTYTSIAASLFRAKGDKDGESIEKLYTALSELREAWEAVS